MKKLIKNLKSVSALMMAVAFFFAVALSACGTATTEGEESDEATEQVEDEAAEEHPSSDEGSEHPSSDSEADSTASEHPSN